MRDKYKYGCINLEMQKNAYLSMICCNGLPKHVKNEHDLLGRRES